MKFATALLALATAAMASPTKFALEERHGDCKSCELEHQTNGYGRYQGNEQPCTNWVPVTEELIVIDDHAEICLNLKAEEDHGLSLDASIKVDVDIDITLLQYRYPAFSHLYCDPNHISTKGEKIREEDCWEHEWEKDPLAQSLSGSAHGHNMVA